MKKTVQPASACESSNPPSGAAQLRTLLTEKEAAERLKVSQRTLQSWRQRGIGPAYTKLGAGTRAPVRYVSDIVDSFVDTCARTSTSQVAV